MKVLTFVTFKIIRKEFLLLRRFWCWLDFLIEISGCSRVTISSTLQHPFLLLFLFFFFWFDESRFRNYWARSIYYYIYIFETSLKFLSFFIIIICCVFYPIFVNFLLFWFLNHFCTELILLFKSWMKPWCYLRRRSIITYFA